MSKSQFIGETDVMYLLRMGDKVLVFG